MRREHDDDDDSDESRKKPTLTLEEALQELTMPTEPIPRDVIITSILPRMDPFQAMRLAREPSLFKHPMFRVIADAVSTDEGEQNRALWFGWLIRSELVGSRRNSFLGDQAAYNRCIDAINRIPDDSHKATMRRYFDQVWYQRYDATLNKLAVGKPRHMAMWMTAFMRTAAKAEIRSANALVTQWLPLVRRRPDVSGSEVFNRVIDELSSIQAELDPVSSNPMGHFTYTWRIGPSRSVFAERRPAIEVLRGNVWDGMCAMLSTMRHDRVEYLRPIIYLHLRTALAQCLHTVLLGPAPHLFFEMWTSARLRAGPGATFDAILLRFASTIFDDYRPAMPFFPQEGTLDLDMISEDNARIVASTYPRRVGDTSMFLGKECSSCGTPDAGHACGAKCGRAVYCNQVCADAHWDQHAH